jgi:HD-GYP domain-containing protein (c-di-GMP phosphodiesterase class II)
MEKLLREIVRRILKAMNLRACEIWLLEDGKYLVPKVGIGIPRKIVKELKLGIGEGITGYTFMEGRTIAVSDVSTDSHKIEKSIARQGKFKSYLGAPIVCANKTIGVLSLYTKTIHEFKSTEINLFTALTSQASLAIANVFLYEKTRRELKRKIEELQALYEVGRTVSSTLDLKDVLLLISTTAAHILAVDASTIRLLNKFKKELILGAYVGLSESYRHKRRVKLGESIAGFVADKRQPLVIKNIKEDKRFCSTDRSIIDEGLISMLSVPLVKGKRVLGVLSVYTRRERDFSKDDVRLLAMFASQAAIALENARLFREIKSGYLNTIKALAAVIDVKDAYTHSHSEKVMEYAVAIATELHLPESDIKAIQYASYLHDVGKIGMDTGILQKRGRLTPDEFAIITEHSRLGSDIVYHVAFLKNLVPIILHHHERYDGKGYPSGLKEKAIPMEARILGVADAYEAMVSDRPYRKSMGKKKALEELKKCKGTQFDPEIVNIFLRILDKKALSLKL